MNDWKSLGRIYVDIDDVLGHTAESILELVEVHHGKTVAWESISHFDLRVSFDLSDDELDDLLDKAHQPEILHGIRPIEGAADALRSWDERGYEIALVTGRPPATEMVSREWLRRSQIPHAHLEFVDKYGRGEDWATGIETLGLDDIAEMEICLAVEDSLEMAVFLAQHHPIEVIVMDRPWNRDLSSLPTSITHRLVRCRSWAEVMERYANP